jgi:hypothetical protein
VGEKGVGCMWDGKHGLNTQDRGVGVELGLNKSEMNRRIRRKRQSSHYLGKGLPSRAGCVWPDLIMGGRGKESGCN